MYIHIYMYCISMYRVMVLYAALKPMLMYDPHCSWLH